MGLFHSSSSQQSAPLPDKNFPEEELRIPTFSIVHHFELTEKQMEQSIERLAIPLLREYHTTTLRYDKKQARHYVIVYGGRTKDEYVDADVVEKGEEDLYEFCLEEREWTVHRKKSLEKSGLEVPKGRINHGAAVVDDKFYIFGGISPHNETIFGDLYCYCFTSKSWQLLSDESAIKSFSSNTNGSNPSSLSNTPAASPNLISPISQASPKSSKHIHDKKNSDIDILDDDDLTGRNNVNHDEKIAKDEVISQSMDGSITNDYQDNEYNSKKNQSLPSSSSSSLAPLKHGTCIVQHPSSRYGHTFVYRNCNHSFIVFGGIDDSLICNDMYEYDIRKKTWYLLEPSETIKPTPRFFHCAAICSDLKSIEGDCLLVYGGCRKPNEYLNDICIYSFDQAKWFHLQQTIGISPPLTCCYDSFMIKNSGNLCLFGGKDDLYVLNIYSRKWEKVQIHGHLLSENTHSIAYNDESNSIVMIESDKKDETFMFQYILQVMMGKVIPH